MVAVIGWEEHPETGKAEKRRGRTHGELHLKNAFHHYDILRQQTTGEGEPGGDGRRVR